MKSVSDENDAQTGLPTYCIFHEWKGPVAIDGVYVVKRSAFAIEFGYPCTDCM